MSESKRPSYAVIFPSQRTNEDPEGYAKTAQRMVELALQQPGCLGFDSARDTQGFGITVSYWESLEAIKAWRDQGEHLEAQAKGRETWYANYDVHITKIEHTYSFRKS
ncbi:antibiotic biosynthesis monooxygenase [Magnetovibrio sp.]|uniref:antibiotic biosynthesis monooxygenase family protein n=1 Tax=Magnetovibrio sp. TaxID=2024836 RepID=UPI002F93F066